MIRMTSVLMLSVMLSSAAFAGGDRDYEVTITNITKNQIFAPVLMATHKSQISLFTPGMPALPELATLAESGNPGPLQALLDGLPNLVLDTNHTGGMLFPGDSITLEISGSSHYNRLSFAGMLVSTNDAFAGLNSMELPKRSASFVVPAYDAGSELNDELCTHVPGPPCGDMTDSGDAGEGFVYIGNGIRGNGDIDPAEFDWNNPVARVQVRRMH